MALTVRQKKFVEEYLRLGIGKEAAINAGYSPRSAEQQASRMLAMPEVQAYRRELEQKLFDEMGISEAWIGRRLVEIVDRSMTAVPHMVWDPDERKKVHDGDWVFDAETPSKRCMSWRYRWAMPKARRRRRSRENPSRTGWRNRTRHRDCRSGRKRPFLFA